MLKREETAAGFVEHARKGEEAEALDKAGWDALGEDADHLGLFGLLATIACPEPPEVDAEVRNELVAALDGDLRDALGEQDQVDLATRFARYVAAKGSRGPDLLSRLVARVIFEVYDLGSHHFFQDDVLAVCELMAWGGPGQDARETARRIVRLSRRGARETLGHMDSQLELVHELGANKEGPINYFEIDRRIFEFAPRIFAQRLPSMARPLTLDEKRFRFAFVLWARLRGIVVGRSGLIDMAQRIEAKRPMLLVQALEERRPTRAIFRRACEEFPVARLIEEVFLARTIAPPDDRPPLY